VAGPSSGLCQGGRGERAHGGKSVDRYGSRAVAGCSIVSLPGSRRPHLVRGPSSQRATGLCAFRAKSVRVRISQPAISARCLMTAAPAHAVEWAAVSRLTARPPRVGAGCEDGEGGQVGERRQRIVAGVDRLLERRAHRAKVAAQRQPARAVPPGGVTVLARLHVAGRLAEVNWLRPKANDPPARFNATRVAWMPKE
jgi:hypothetical protein